jgi:lipid II:glycine glycyltransferase (peptidoglycan interpeptide bridge formation enzyme)
MKWGDVSLADWEAFVGATEQANFLQSPQWGSLHERMGDTVIRRGLHDGARYGGGYQAIVKDARRGRYLELPGAPLIDWSDSAARASLKTELMMVAKQYGCVFVRIRPQLYDTPEHRVFLTDAGFKKAPMHLHAEHTNMLALANKTDDELLVGMRRQTRYEVRRSLKQELTVSFRSDTAAVEEFFTVQADTARRQGFIPPSKKFLQEIVAAFGEKARIYRVEHEGRLLNLALVLRYGNEADYYEAASTDTAREYAGAYALQWQAIRDARDAGAARYNFWGIAYSNDPHHRYAGVTTFKRGFGGEDTNYFPAHDMVVDPLKYPKNWIIETIRRKRRKL